MFVKKPVEKNVVLDKKNLYKNVLKKKTCLYLNWLFSGNVEEA